MAFMVGMMMFGACLGCQQSDGGSGEPCANLQDCGIAGEVLCLDQHCQEFDTLAGYGSAVIAISFPQNLYNGASSGRIYLLHPELSTGAPLGCEEIQDATVLPEDLAQNPLTANPKYVVFDWSSGGTFFPDILVAFVRPSAQVVVVVQAFALLNAEGSVRALGCTDSDLTISKDQATSATVSMTAR
jgi:hypothetical protein